MSVVNLREECLKQWLIFPLRIETGQPVNVQNLQFWYYLFKCILATVRILFKIFALTMRSKILLHSKLVFNK